MSKKKVLYVIYSSHPKAGGGHYHSLLAIIKSLSPHIDIKVLNVGLIHAPSLVKNIKSDYIHIDRLSYFFKMPSIIKYIKDYNPDVIHAFDSGSLSILRTANFVIKKPIVFSKCGGVNGGPFIQDADAYVNFSEENTIHYAKYKKNNLPVSLLPNRATKIKPDTERIQVIRQTYSLTEDKKVVLRIARFHELHEGSIMQTVNLFKLLYDSGKTNYVLLLIGMVQSESVLNRVKKECENYPAIILTEPYYTSNASELIDISDIVVTTGRGTMEAASFGKILFAPIKGRKLPAPVNKKNLPAMISFNFSERTEGVSVTEEEILQYLDGNLNDIQVFIEGVFREYFDVESVVPDYLAIYNTVQRQDVTSKYLKNYTEDVIRFLKPSFISKNYFTRKINK